MNDVGSGINCEFVRVGMFSCTDQCQAIHSTQQVLTVVSNNLFLAVSSNRDISL